MINKINVELLVGLFTLLVIVVTTYFILYYDNTTEIPVLEQPTDDIVYERMLMKRCTFWASKVPNETLNYRVIDYECGFLQGTPHGETLEVEILNHDKELGEQVFLNTLKEHGVDDGGRFVIKFQ